jgi:hypothetical protein
MEGFLELVCDFIEASKKFSIQYHNYELFKIMKIISGHRKSTDLILYVALQKNIHLVTQYNMYCE